MSRPKRFVAADCETDKFLLGRVPKPFIWGVYDGDTFRTFRETNDFVDWIKTQSIIVYAHNGGKFDFMFLLQFIQNARAQIINGRIVKVHIGKAELRDSFAIIPEALRKFGTKGEIDYDKMEADVREQHMPEILEYLKGDCVTLYNVVAAYRKTAGKQITIASNALKFCRSIGIDPGKTNASFDDDMRAFYFGGRTECFQPGIHKTIRVLDIHSAYPFAMCQDHASGSERISITGAEFEKLTIGERQRCFIKLSCNARGCFPYRTQTGLDFPHRKDTYHVTGWEFEEARELGLVDEIHYLEILHFPDKINFKPYVDHWFKYKASYDKKTNPIEYTIGKIMMNSLYGKLAQNPARYFDYQIHKGGSIINRCEGDFTHGKTCFFCGEGLDNHGWEIAAEFDNIEIHRREALWKHRIRFGDRWRARPLYNNVATGASITGFTRAHLLRAIHAIGIKQVIYSDTDSIICAASASLSGLSLSDNLGDWADEGIGDIGYFAGKKLYGIKTREICKKYEPFGVNDLRCGKCFHTDKGHGRSRIFKIASKGSRLDFDQIRRIVQGEKITWSNHAPSFSIAGQAKFVVRSIRSTAILPATQQTTETEFDYEQ